MEQYPLVSVYTCVYNGARTIHRVFDSMKHLDYPKLEHIIVNDGSVDDTEQLVQAYTSEVSFPVKYHKKENGGKHTALNAAWDLAEGEFLVQLDADDELLPHSVRFLVDTYYQIPEKIRGEYWCVHGRCVTQHGEFVGDHYPEEINGQNWKQAAVLALKCRGEKVGLQVRKYLQPYRFPEVVGLSHVPESILWSQVNQKYGTWYTNEVIRVYYVGEGGNLTAAKTQRKQFAQTCYRFKWRLMHPEWYRRSLRDLLCYSVLYFISDKRFRKNNGYTQELQKLRFGLFLIAPPAWFAAFAIRILKRIR